MMRRRLIALRFTFPAAPPGQQEMISARDLLSARGVFARDRMLTTANEFFYVE